MKKILFLIAFIVTGTLFSQDITLTLGTNGTFRINDPSTTLLSLQQSTGELNLSRSMRLSNTYSPGLGVIYKGYDTFIHDYLPSPYISSNIFIGSNSGNFTMSYIANYNTALGRHTLKNNSSGSHNTAIGTSSLSVNTTGNNNTALGSATLTNNTSGSNNTALGYYSLTGNQIGSNNTAVGTYSLFSSQHSGYYNTALGSYSMYSNSSGYQNSALGYNSLYSNTTGVYNTALGNSSLYYNSSGYRNNALGFASLYLNTVGYNNTAIGDYAMFYNTSGNHNTVVGSEAGYQIYSGSLNTVIGRNAAPHLTTGSSNTILGYFSGYNLTSGSNNILIGNLTQPTSSNVNNQITLGNSDITSLRCNVTTITSLSDARDKKNIKDLSLGLDFIAKLRPRLYNWDKREWYERNTSDGSKMEETPTAGFIAQELDEAQTNSDAEWLNLVLKDNPEKWEATPGNLLPVMVKAIQELNTKCESLQEENKMLKSQAVSYSVLNEKLDQMEKQINELKNNLKYSQDTKEVNNIISSEK